MSEQKRPKATFGDVMLGIPAGGRGERDGGGSRGERDGGGSRGGRDARGGERAGSTAGAAGRAAGEPHDHRSEERPGERKSGPLVVVKRAGGAIETRRLEAAAAAAAASAAGVGTGGDAPGAAGAVQGVGGGEAAAVKPEVRPHVSVNPGVSVADDVHEHESFAEMFEKAGRDAVPGRKGVRVGEKVKGKIFQLGAEMAFLTIGKQEAMLALDELKDDEGVLRFGVGDEIEAHVMEMGAKGVLLSRRLSKSAASVALLTEARQSGMPVEGLVLGINKGGLEVAVGEVRAFCPTSQIDVRPVSRPDELIGQRLTFRVTEIKDRGNVVLSRRSILEEENRARAAELRKTLAVGKVVQGRVVNVQAFGAFVDLGGLEGLIPVSEMSHVRIGHPNEVVKVGDQVEVELIRMEEAEPNAPDKAKRKERITLSMRKLMEDPFAKLVETLKEGALVRGKVVRLQPFGAFVELAPGVDGLIHISALSERRIAHPRDAVEVGQEIDVKVEKIDEGEKRVGLRLVKDGVPVGEGGASSAGGAAASVAGVGEGGGEAKAGPAPRPAKPRRGQIVKGRVVRIEQYGVFLEWAEGQQGLVPAAETGTERGTDLKRVFPMGSEHQAEVIELERDRVKLSFVAAKRSEERADLDAWKAEQAKKVKATGGFNSLADKLRGLTVK